MIGSQLPADWWDQGAPDQRYALREELRALIDSRTPETDLESILRRYSIERLQEVFQDL